MLGYLIYHRDEAEKNKAFIRLFQEEGKRLGIVFELADSEEYQQKPLPELVLNRTRSVQISRWYEQRGVLTLHSSRITEIGNDKGKTLQYLESRLPAWISRQKWAPETIRVPAEALSGVSVRDLSFFQILKTVDGHGGNEVYDLVGTKDSIRSLQQKFYGRTCILQEKIVSDGKDIRVYIVGGQIYQAMLRQGAKDFRSNFSLGGTASPYWLSEEERKFVQGFADAFAEDVLGIAGLDFILTRDNRLVFNELEEMVGCRMLYQCTDLNIVRDFLVWLVNFVENDTCHPIRL